MINKAIHLISRLPAVATGIALTLALAASGAAAEEIRTTTVAFAPGSDGASISDHIKGRETVDYLLRAKAGQTLIATLDTGNPRAYFNVMPPGTKMAIFIGSSEGNRFEGELPTNGEYTIRVYLMRAVARRGKKAEYTLKVRIPAGDPAPQSDPDDADGLSGGPDFWEVSGVPAGDGLNLRAGPSTHEPALLQLANGTVLRNLGCSQSGSQRWCQVERPREPSPRGWVAGRYLRESAYTP